MSAPALAAAAPAAERTRLLDALAVGAAMLFLLLYSQGWILPIMGEKFDAASSGLIRAAYLPGYAAGAFILALTPGRTFQALIRQPFLVALMLIVAASWFWSVAPDQTARRVFAVYCTTLGGVVLAARWRWSSLAEILAGVFAILAVASFLAGLALPSIGRMQEIFPGAWRGLWPEKNALGGNMAIGFTLTAAAAFLNPKRAAIWGGFAALCLLLVLLSTSKTSLVSLLLGAGGLAFVWMIRRGPATGVAATWAAIVGIGLIAAVFLFAADQVFELLGKDATLTGRTKIWAAAMHQIEQRPWTGYGYGAVWTDQSRWGPLAWITKEAGFRAQHSHNSWIEQWLELGVPGLAMFGLFFIQTGLAAIVAVYRSKGAYLAAPFFIVYSLITVTESVAVTYNDLRWVLFVAIAVKLWLGDPPDAERLRSGSRPPAPRPPPVR